MPESPFDNVVEMGVRALTYSVENVQKLVVNYPYVAIGIASVLGLVILSLIVSSMRGGAKDEKKKGKQEKSTKKSGEEKKKDKKKAT